MKMIDLVDMRIKLKSKRSNNKVAKSSKSLYYQRSKTAAEELTAILGHH